jgi:hypothetical protein
MKQSMHIDGKYTKRNKLYSKGKWVDTSPLVINEHFEIISLDLGFPLYSAIDIYSPKIINTSLLKVNNEKVCLDLIIYKKFYLDLIVYKVSLDLILYKVSLELIPYKWVYGDLCLSYILASY